MRDYFDEFSLFTITSKKFFIDYKMGIFIGCFAQARAFLSCFYWSNVLLWNVGEICSSKKNHSYEAIHVGQKSFKPNFTYSFYGNALSFVFNLFVERMRMSKLLKDDWKLILERVGYAWFFDKSSFPALFSNLFYKEKSAGNSHLSNVCTDPSRFNIFSLKDNFKEPSMTP